MKKIIALFVGLIPSVSLAVTVETGRAVPGTTLVNDTEGIIKGMLTFINSYVITLLFAVIFVRFAYGIYQTFIAGAADPGTREKGQSVIINSVIGAVVIVSFWGLVNFFAGGIGLTDAGVKVLPRVPAVKIVE